MANGDNKEYVTKTMLNEAVDSILNGMNTLFENLKVEIGKIRIDVKGLRDEIKGIKVELSHVKDEMNGVKAELSDTPSRREVEELKAKVEKHSSLS